MGPEAKARFVRAAELIVEFSDTRLPEEAAVYGKMVESATLARRALPRR